MQQASGLSDFAESSRRVEGRLAGFDYSREALYFLTLCCKDRAHLFGEVIDNQMDDGQYRVKDIWQRNYYEHIIRDENSYKFISDYIRDNPEKWKDDCFYSRRP
ncbi:MAG: hypothetical protein ACYC1Q_05840 [Bacteroidia bacterium]